MKSKTSLILALGAMLVLAAGPVPSMGDIPDDCPAGMVSYWQLDETSGTIASDSYDFNDGTLVNGPVWTPGKVDGALSFDGIDDYVIVPDADNLDITGAITVEAWLKPATVSASPDWRAVVYKLHTSGADKGGYGLMAETDQSGVYFFTEAAGVCFAGAAALTPDAWNHVVGTYDDAGNIAIYVNGTYQDGGNFPGYAPHQTDRPLYLGGNPDDDGFARYEFEGVIDEVAVYSRALTAGEIADHYNNGAGRNYCATPISGFDAEIYAGCNDPCDNFRLDFKLSGTDVRFFHFEYPLPTSPACIDLVSSSPVSGLGIVFWKTVMFGDVLHIDGTFDSPNFTGANVKIGEICFNHDGTCENTVQTLTCIADEVRDGDGNLVDVSPGEAIINLDNTAPTKDHPGNITPCYSAPGDPDWVANCWDLNFYKGGEEWQCELLRATIQIYKASGCGSGDLVFTNHFFTTPISGDYNICYPTNQTERDEIWAATHTAHGDGIYYVELTVWDNCCNFDSTCDAFTFCIDTETDNDMTCLDARPAHNHICLQWNYTYDPVNAVRLRILRSPYRAGNYPEYTLGDPVPPSGYDDPTWDLVYEGDLTYPCSGADWYQDGVFTNDNRDIYWYAGFTKDAAGNWSSRDMTLSIGADRATSYWLGDVTDVSFPNPPDGQVFGAAGDAHCLSAAYGTSDGEAYWDPFVDYGPETQDHGIGRGIPEPDDVINYEDLLPFSFNYNIVGPSGECDNWPRLPGTNPPRQLNKNADEIAAVWLEQIESTHPDGITFALMLTNPGDATHLFHSRISYNTNALSLVEVRHGELGVSEGFTEFFGTPTTGEGLVDVDLAALGPDGYLIGSGAVAYLDFSYEASEMASVVRLEEAILYDGEGNEINLSPTDVEVENQGEAIPTEFALHHNHPNPFNPTTTIKYDLPQATYVKLVVYNVRGQKVATLVDGLVEAGRQQVIWNAKDLSSGIYFYKITAGNFTNMHKMILLK